MLDVILAFNFDWGTFQRTAITLSPTLQFRYVIFLTTFDHYNENQTQVYCVFTMLVYVTTCNVSPLRFFFSSHKTDFSTNHFHHSLYVWQIL